MRVLVVDDERQIARVLRTSLESFGYEVQLAENGSDALTRMRTFAPDLVITDLSMPVMDGVELTREIRKASEIPIIVLSVREQDASKILALDSGADDYVTKPFSTPELLARVRVQLRRRAAAATTQESSIEAGPFRIDVDAHRVEVRGEEVHLTPKEFDLLLLLLRNTGRVMTHRALLRGVWGSAGEGQPEYLRVLVAQLRRKIDRPNDESYIRSEPWVGYRLETAESDEHTTS